MRCYQLPTEANHDPLAIRKNSWHWKDLSLLYESDHTTRSFKKQCRSLPDVDKKRFGLVTYLDQLQDRHLYHLTLTYKPYSDIEYSEKDVNQFFTRFYLRHFLPYLTNSKHFNRPSVRTLQPICLAFIDGHTHEPMRYGTAHHSTTSLPIAYSFSARLHHHAILAVHPATVATLQTYIGENTFADGHFSHKIMTSDLKQCDAPRLFYASKLLTYYPDFLSFPDRCARA